MTPPQACRFDKDRVCLTHSYKGMLEKYHYAVACDIGLSALRRQLEEEKSKPESDMVPRSRLDAVEEELRQSKEKREEIFQKASLEITRLARVIAKVYSLMRRYDGTVGTVSPLRTFLTELDQALSPEPT